MRANVEAEQAVLGAAISSEAAHTAFLSLQESDFTQVRHRVIATVLRDMIRKNTSVDVITLADEIRGRGKMNTPGGVGSSTYLHDLVSLAPVPGAAAYYARMVRDAARVNAAAVAGQALVDQLGREEAEAELDSVLTMHRSQLEKIPPEYDEEDTQERDTVASLLGEVFGSQQWITPGLLARGERVVITGAEGLAKSTLLRQAAVCMAGGLNMWNGQRVSDGHRVLFVDAENSRFQSHNAYGWISRRVVRPMIAQGWADRIVHKTRNDGVDLPGRDAGWFLQQAANFSPDVIILGPAYKLMRGDPQKDSDVLALLQIIDEVRVKHDAAVLVETHSPHGVDGHRPVRPYGSSVWLRWPEVGFGLREDKDARLTRDQRAKDLQVVGWRGQRETRDWPDLITHGEPRELPWKHGRPDWKPSVDTAYSVRELTA